MYHQGDLTDIIRAGGGETPPAAAVSAAEWQFVSNIPVAYTTEPGPDDFGDPFTHFRDPLLRDIENPGFVHNNPGNTVLGFGNNNNININIIGQKDINLDDEMKRPNFFSRMIQISPVGNNAKLPAVAPPPCDSPAAARGLKPPPILVSNDQGLMMSSNSSKSCLVESPAGLQISSPRNTGIRRRKSQVKKVVCIPAPTPANSRSTGEIVPSDLWAWRKYGQKPIKGSPYPRGYYRCSSSKGCSARKQVERSRTDPNMLVITYTSEHNHPWPTQRNALAGSTRSQPSKTNAGPKSPSSSQKPTNPKEEQKEINSDEITTVPSPTTVDPNPVKEELIMDHDDFDLEMDGADFGEGFRNSYKPILPDNSNRPEDSFFADLGEIEADTLDIFGFAGDDGRDNKGLDPFGFYEWAGSGGGANSGGGGATTSFGDAN
ncbi:probable WRKY transcription factor 14 [Phtheirospermum japonicum]|uniref:Probable WRKY transcription factor 14 n=1 Tax=Phtheirospermum japonicum TaxID=374723 RepID=A0A830DL99_9LAMI|nr:probable WRKY transcription factor 14 [Phtheirospermum japonicum]